ncbi:glycosyltransferase family 39 protein [Candidatus Microgenomates bacterium]|nr:glycosyltransferase family 39 protein [Candidatus Microgenomates bacterium]
MVHTEIYFVSFIKRHIRRMWSHQEHIVALVAFVLSVASLVYFYQRGLLVAYGDAESHMNIAKRVVSGLTPGFGQLGGNWPPFHHLLMLPFVWNDWMWRTGVGASVVSMACYIASAVLIFKLIKHTLRYNRAAWLGALIFMLNPGVLYMQVTAMSEMPMILSLIGTVYYFARWTTYEHPFDIIAAAAFVFMGSLTRYDSWFLAFSCVAAILLVGLMKHFTWRKTEGAAIFFSVVSFAGIGLWILWNMLIFKDPLYFMSSPYSAKSQQQQWLAKGQLPSYHDMASSYSFYTVTVLHNAGYAVMGVAMLGLIILLYNALKGRYSRTHIVSMLLLATPFPFYVLTLYMGISIILIPDLLPKSWEFNLFNVRYGMMMIPFAAVMAAAVAAAYRRVGFALVMAVLVFQAYSFWQGGAHVVLRDAEYGLSARRPSPVNQFIAKNYDNGFVMFDDFSRSANPIDLGIPMNQIVYVGNHPIWDDSLKQPETHVKWLIVRRDENDVLWQKYRQDTLFSRKYQLVYNWQKTGVYRRWDKNTSAKTIDAETIKMKKLLESDNAVTQEPKPQAFLTQ